MLLAASGLDEFYKYFDQARRAFRRLSRGSINGGTPQYRWMVYSGKSHQKWMIWGYPYFRNPPYIYNIIYIYILIQVRYIYTWMGVERVPLRLFVTVCCSQEISQKEIWTWTWLATHPLATLVDRVISIFNFLTGAKRREFSGMIHNNYE